MNYEPTAYVLGRYRTERRFERPVPAARGLVASLAQSIADAVTEGDNLDAGYRDFLIPCYEAAKRLHAEVSRRAGLDHKGDLSRSETFWLMTPRRKAAA